MSMVAVKRYVVPVLCGVLGMLIALLLWHVAGDVWWLHVVRHRGSGS